MSSGALAKECQSGGQMYLCRDDVSQGGSHHLEDFLLGPIGCTSLRERTHNRWVNTRVDVIFIGFVAFLFLVNFLEAFVELDNKLFYK